VNLKLIGRKLNKKIGYNFWIMVFMVCLFV